DAALLDDLIDVPRRLGDEREDFFCLGAQVRRQHRPGLLRRGVARNELRRDLFDDVFDPLDELGALADQAVRSTAAAGPGGARNGEDLATLLERLSGRDQRSALLGRLDYDNADGEAADDAVPRRKMKRKRRRSDRQFGDNRAALADAPV